MTPKFIDLRLTPEEYYFLERVLLGHYVEDKKDMKLYDGIYDRMVEINKRLKFVEEQNADAANKAK